MDTPLYQITQSPYIPERHERYDLLPRLRKEGGEVFVTSTFAQEARREVSKLVDLSGNHLFPVALPQHYASYQEYFSELFDLFEQVADDGDVSAYLQVFMGAQFRLNRKEEWSVLLYIGDHYDGLEDNLYLTPGRFYYWPSCFDEPEYCGVIDNTETVPFLYPCDPKDWMIFRDPTGMAKRALEGEAQTIPYWYGDEYDPEAVGEFEEPVKHVWPPSGVRDELDIDWPTSSRTAGEVACPSCGRTHWVKPWTVVNARTTPQLADRVISRDLFLDECPYCHEESQIPSECIYLDPDHNSIAYLAPAPESEESAERMFEAFKENGRFPGVVGRIVREPSELADKALAWREGLDDHLIEFLKDAELRVSVSNGVYDADEPLRVWFNKVVHPGHDWAGIDIVSTDGSKCHINHFEWWAIDEYIKYLHKLGVDSNDTLYVDQTWLDEVWRASQERNRRWEERMLRKLGEDEEYR